MTRVFTVAQLKIFSEVSMPQQSLLFIVSCFSFSFCLALLCQSYPEAPVEATSYLWTREYFALFSSFCFCFVVFFFSALFVF